MTRSENPQLFFQCPSFEICFSVIDFFSNFLQVVLNSCSSCCFQFWSRSSFRTRRHRGKKRNADAPSVWTSECGRPIGLCRPFLLVFFPIFGSMFFTIFHLMLVFLHLKYKFHVFFWNIERSIYRVLCPTWSKYHKCRPKCCECGLQKMPADCFQTIVQAEGVA